YACALLDHFKRVGTNPDPVTGMWRVSVQNTPTHRRLQTVEHLNTFMRAAHLIPQFGVGFIPDHWPHSLTLDSFSTFYVNKYADHHSHEIAF
ncbi:hypothetical protein OF83DRAFT_1068145, partial [Amylostereum chailletii]